MELRTRGQPVESARMSHHTLKLIITIVFGMIAAGAAGKHAKNGRWGSAGVLAWLALYFLILVMQNVFTEGA
jgi:hypothetical protein